MPADDTVARRDVADACTDGCDDAHTFGNGNARFRELAGVGALWDLQVAVDHANQSWSDDDLTRPATGSGISAATRLSRPV
ncbi:hypothetical protein OC00_04510 [Xanthomonas vasicola]|nr:hypothetical protein NX08_000760 [Xanthomonas vasicola]KGR55316.1 hypothetical protein NX07_01695 [Xanthomonas vasicola]KGR56833.1 hypothetical protein NX09_06685 [Xanthomonas vasicola]KGT85238.1 hypothetical protein OC00_04510 [Xanthomonas vasicola]